MNRQSSFRNRFSEPPSDDSQDSQDSQHLQQTPRGHHLQQHLTSGDGDGMSPLTTLSHQLESLSTCTASSATPATSTSPLLTSSGGRASGLTPGMFYMDSPMAQQDSPRCKLTFQGIFGTGESPDEVDASISPHAPTSLQSLIRGPILKQPSNQPSNQDIEEEESMCVDRNTPVRPFHLPLVGDEGGETPLAVPLDELSCSPSAFTRKYSSAASEGSSGGARAKAKARRKALFDTVSPSSPSPASRSGSRGGGLGPRHSSFVTSPLASDDLPSPSDVLEGQFTSIVSPTQSNDSQSSTSSGFFRNPNEFDIQTPRSQPRSQSRRSRCTRSRSRSASRLAAPFASDNMLKGKLNFGDEDVKDGVSGTQAALEATDAVRKSGSSIFTRHFMRKTSSFEDLRSAMSPVRAQESAVGSRKRRLSTTTTPVATKGAIKKRKSDENCEPRLQPISHSPSNSDVADCTERRFKRNNSDTSLEVKQALEKTDWHGNLIADFSRAYALPMIRGRCSELNCISSQTMIDLLNGKYSESVNCYVVVDCRYPYEYAGGHIKDAVNYYLKEDLLQYFFSKADVDTIKAKIENREQIKMQQMPKDYITSPFDQYRKKHPGRKLFGEKQPLSIRKELFCDNLKSKKPETPPSVKVAPKVEEEELIAMSEIEPMEENAGFIHTERTIIIMHCEYSSERAPKMIRYLRAQDRLLHKYPVLRYPEIYLLEGGYKAFYEFAEGAHCKPKAYLSMHDKDHEEDLRFFRSRTKSWDTGGSNTMARSNKVVQ